MLSKDSRCIVKVISNFIFRKYQRMQEMVIMPAEQLLQQVKSIVEAAISNRDKTETEEKLLSAAEACKLFQPAISKVSLHRWTKDGLIPVHRFRGRIWYKQSDIIAASKSIRKYDRNKPDQAAA